MAYTLQRFEDGQILTAKHLNNIENGLTVIEQSINTKQDKITGEKDHFLTFDEQGRLVKQKVIHVGEDVTAQDLIGNDGHAQVEVLGGTRGEIFNCYPKDNGGKSNIASGDYSHAEGEATNAGGRTAHAEGNGSSASGDNSHAEGELTKALGKGSHAEGYITLATGDYSHSEGSDNDAKGKNSHAEGINNQANGTGSHVEGIFNVASGEYSHVQGIGSIPDSNYAHVVGNGELKVFSNPGLDGADLSTIYLETPSNAHTLDWQGNAWYSGDVYVHSTSGTNRDDGSLKLITMQDVEAKITYGQEDLEAGVSPLADGVLYFVYE